MTSSITFPSWGDGEFRFAFIPGLLYFWRRTGYGSSSRAIILTDFLNFFDDMNKTETDMDYDNPVLKYVIDIEKMGDEYKGRY